jgi:hypothetical protein
MADQSEQDRIPSKLADDLDSLFAPPIRVPGHVDDAILNRARAHLAQRPRSRRPLWWVGTAAAAACVLLVMRVALRGPTLPDDLDGNRRVDIVDALILAKQIDAGKGRDINGDGVIDSRDVDTIAMAAVQLDAGVQ